MSYKLDVQYESALYVSLSGAIDAVSSEEFSNGLIEKIDRASETLIVIDLEGLEFLNSMGLGAIIRVWNAVDVQGKKIRILASRRIAEVFRVSHIDTLIELHVMDTPEE